ncbi:ATP-binding protein [Candidatus Woesearchaeota archaeon]|nr:ATP-binding protein [Candidatus Aenigmarchaeota archaeon]MBI2647457.1 ATP-binding protein [Candidatus Woesearchaeota archaeon]
MITRETLKEVIISQREFLNKSEQGTLRERKEEIKIEDSFVIIITGIRRCGKSTFLNQILKKQKRGYYLDLEDPRLEGFELSDFNKVEAIMKEIYGGGGIYFFDEIQNISRWEKFIRYLTDKKERIIITGSNATLLSRELGTKLTGRHLQVEMFPFSFVEFLDMKAKAPSIKSFEEYLYKGGFPEYLKKENPSILHQLLSDVVMKDIAVRFGIKNTNILNKIAVYLISNAGKEFSHNSIKKIFEIKSVQSVIDYVSYFENAYLVFTIPRFSYSYRKQQVNPKKVYSIDNGFSYNNSASFSKDMGKMLENVVFLGLRRKFKDIFYFQEKNECDFVVKEKEKVTSAIQVCFDFNEETKNREISGLISALNEFKLKTGLILTYNQDDEFLVDDKKIIVKPVWKWLLKS